MYLVVFRNRKRADIDADAYAQDAARMEAMATQRPGYLSFKSYVADDGEVVAISEWETRAAAKAWRAEAHHAEIQARGRAEYYESYTVITCDNPWTHSFP
ncbi:antibiotic biosynthesis monooxygenase family protein [Qipengyuania sp. DSG2-2]|uniref:antibiotic biosynthesis monooxygenase family protein n=1 Tax=Qipengyuania sp. DGS2-2 TaxID=3349631 RepID=UPI0036D3BFFA